MHTDLKWFRFIELFLLNPVAFKNNLEKKPPTCKHEVLNSYLLIQIEMQQYTTVAKLSFSIEKKRSTIIGKDTLYARLTKDNKQ